MLIEFERGRPIIVDRSMYRELVKGAIKRTHDELETKAAAAAQEKKAAHSSKAPADPLTTAKRERDAQLRELTDQAHGANLDLGVALMNGLAAVDPGDIDVARFFVLCRRRHRANYADYVAMPMRGSAREQGGKSVALRSEPPPSRFWRGAGTRPVGSSPRPLPAAHVITSAGVCIAIKRDWRVSRPTTISRCGRRGGRGRSGKRARRVERGRGRRASSSLG